jgi:phosphate transport system permease protein
MARVTTFGYLPIIAQAFSDHVDSLGIEHEVGMRSLADMISEERIDGFLQGPRDHGLGRARQQRDARAAGAGAGAGDAGSIETRFNFDFITAPDASGQRPEAAGLGVAIVGSFYMMLVVLALSLPIGVAASIYLEEFAPKNRFTDLIEVNISNLAAVPSIVFGILGLAVFINFAGLPQSAPSSAGSC